MKAGPAQASITAIAWGIEPLLLSAAFSAQPASYEQSLLLAWLRLTTAAAVLTFLCRRTTFPRIERAQALAFAIAGVFLVGNFFAFLTSLTLLDPILAVFLLQIGPLAYAVIGILSGERLTGTQWISLMAALGGYVALALSVLGGEVRPMGILIAVGAGLCWTGYACTVRIASSSHSIHQANTVVLLLAALLLFPFIGFSTVLFEPLVWLALGCNVLAYLSLGGALERGPKSIVGAILAMNPVLTLVLGYLLGRDSEFFTRVLPISAAITAVLGTVSLALLKGEKS